MSEWLRYVTPVTGSVAEVSDGRSRKAVFIRRYFTWSGVRFGSFCRRSAAAPLTIGAAMLVPLNWIYSEEPSLPAGVNKDIGTRFSGYVRSNSDSLADNEMIRFP